MNSINPIITAQRAARQEPNSHTGKLGHGLARIFTDLLRVDPCNLWLFATFLEPCDEPNVTFMAVGSTTVYRSSSLMIRFNQLRIAPLAVVSWNSRRNEMLAFRLIVIVASVLLA